MPSRLEPGLGDGGVANSGVCELVVLRTSQGVAMSKGQFGSATDAVAKHSMMTHPYGGPHLTHSDRFMGHFDPESAASSSAVSIRRGVIPVIPNSGYTIPNS